MNILTNHLVLAAGNGVFSGKVGNQDFWTGSPLGQVLAALLGVLGILVVVFALIRVVKHIAGGKMGEAFKTVIGAVVLATFLFQPSLVNQVIGAGGTIVQKVIQTVSDIGNTGSSTTTTGN